MGDFLKELKRRNVVRVAIAYGVVGWIIIEIASTLEPALLLPDWFSRVVTVLVVLGFPVALLFAWAFELTPEGLKRTKDVDVSQSVTSQTGKKLEYMIIAALGVALVFMVFKTTTMTEEANEAVATANATPSIAVLPFEDFSPNRDQEYFSNGIAEEILNLLAQNNALKVAARTSSFAFRGEEHDIREIGQKLDVSTVLEGSIRKSGPMVRITAQLINVKDGYHIWSETYDRELSDIFAIQDEIATNIMESLKVHLLGEVAQQSAVRSADVDAYNSYLIGRQRMTQQTQADFEAAKDRFEEAISRDATFAPARVQLVLAALELERLADSGMDKEKARQATDAIAAAQLGEARRLAPDLPEVEAIEGLYDLRRFRYEKARAHLDRAIALNPNYAQAYLWRADLHYEDSDYKAMLADRETAYRLDPMSLEISRELAYDYRSFWRPEDAERIIQRMFELRPGHEDAFAAKASNLSAQGKYAEVVPVLEEAIALHPDQDRFKGFLAAMLIYLDEPDAAKALGQDWVEFQIDLKDGRLDDAKAFLEPRLAGDERGNWLWAGLALYRQTGEKDKLREILKDRIAQYERRGQPWQQECHMYLMEEMQFAGMSENWDSMMAACRHDTEERVEAKYLCPCSWFNLVTFAILDGRLDDAVMRANEWLDKGDSWYDLDEDPIFAKLKDRPEYPDLLRRNRDQMARQRRMYLEARAAAGSGTQSE